MIKGGKVEQNGQIHLHFRRMRSNDSPRASRFVSESGSGWRRIEHRFVLLASSDGLRHGIVNLQDRFFGAIIAELLLVLPPDNWEGVHDVGNSVVGLRK